MRLGEQLGAEHLPEEIPEDAHPVIQHILERHHSGSTRDARDDDRVIALTVEGGGQRGSISAGMLVAFDAMGLMDTVDMIYGVSSGALNASYAASGQGALGITNYEDAASKRFINYARPLKGEPIVDLDYLFEDLVKSRRPHNEAGLAAGPEFRAVVVDPENKTVEVLQNFEDTDDLADAVRASCSIPILSKTKPYRGRELADGGLLAPLAYKQARKGGATDVLALRTRPAPYRKSGNMAPVVAETIFRPLAGRALAELIAGQPEVYNAQAEQLSICTALEGPVCQIAPDMSVPEISRTERSLEKVRAGMRAGAAAVVKAFGAPNVELLWRPTAFVPESPALDKQTVE